MEKIEIKASEGTHEIIVREGKASENFKVRKAINISGTIGLPLAHLEKESETIVNILDKVIELKSTNIITESYLLIDRDLMAIEFVENAGKEYESRYEGKLKLNRDFLKFKVNHDETFTTIELANLIKMNRSFFESKTIAMKLVSTLRDFEAKIDKEVELKISDRGDKRTLKAQTVTTNIPAGFKMKLPIFKGQKELTFEIEIGIDPYEMSCRLISPEVNDIINETKNTIIDEQLAAIKELHDGLRIFEI
jgi:hypothetical protein